jgi:hypothetical protein
MARFLGPANITTLSFILVVLLMPVIYIRTEPEHTNYLPGEKSSSTTNTEVLQSTFDEFINYTDGNPDSLLGIIIRNFLRNLAGIPLLAINYCWWQV